MCDKIQTVRYLANGRQASKGLSSGQDTPQINTPEAVDTSEPDGGSSGRRGEEACRLARAEDRRPVEWAQDGSDPSNIAADPFGAQEEV